MNGQLDGNAEALEDFGVSLALLLSPVLGCLESTHPFITETIRDGRARKVTIALLVSLVEVTSSSQL